MNLLYVASSNQRKSETQLERRTDEASVGGETSLLPLTLGWQRVLDGKSIHKDLHWLIDEVFLVVGHT